MRKAQDHLSAGLAEGGDLRLREGEVHELHGTRLALGRGAVLIGLRQRRDFRSPKLKKRGLLDAAEPRQHAGAAQGVERLGDDAPKPELIAHPIELLARAYGEAVGAKDAQ